MLESVGKPIKNKRFTNGGGVIIKTNTRNIVLTALFAALTAVGAFIRVPVGPVPISLQVFFVLLAGVLLGPWWGMLSQAVYILLGLAGLPVFTAGGGPQYVLNPGFGYLLGFLLAALVVGLTAGRGKRPGFWRLLAACALGVLAAYAVGVPYMALILRAVSHTPLTASAALQSGFLIFLPGDAVKCVGAALLGVRLTPVLRRA